MGVEASTVPSGRIYTSLLVDLPLILLPEISYSPSAVMLYATLASSKKSCGIDF